MTMSIKLCHNIIKSSSAMFFLTTFDFNFFQILKSEGAKNILAFSLTAIYPAIHFYYHWHRVDIIGCLSFFSFSFYSSSSSFSSSYSSSSSSFFFFFFFFIQLLTSFIGIPNSFPFFAPTSLKTDSMIRLAFVCGSASV